MKYNYPIKYALIPIPNCSGTDVLGYLVSKCYVVSEEKKYHDNGAFSVKYGVVFPYEFDYQMDTIIRSIPTNRNAKRVSEIFDTMEEALEQLKLANEELVESKTLYIPSHMAKDKWQEMNKSFEQYKEFGKMLEQYNGDLIVGEKHKKQNIILVDNERNRVIKDSLYNYMKIYCDTFFSAYHVSIEKFEQIKRQIENNVISNEIYGKCLLRNNPNEHMTQIYDYNSTNENGCFYISPDSLEADNILFYDKNMSFLPRNENETVIYTMEDYEDVIKSYIPNLRDDEITINGKTFAKRIKLK